VSFFILLFSRAKIYRKHFPCTCIALQSKTAHSLGSWCFWIYFLSMINSQSSSHVVTIPDYILIVILTRTTLQSVYVYAHFSHGRS
jgi:hypothetical protein